MPRVANRPSNERVTFDTEPNGYGEPSEEEIEYQANRIVEREKSVAETISDEYAQRFNIARKEDAPPPKRHLMYWAKCARPDCFYHRDQRGYIFHHVGTLGPGGPQQVAEFAEHTHATPLPEFGQWPANNQAVHGDRDDSVPGLNSADFNPNSPWGNFKWLFTAPGGLDRMPIEQFIQCGFHRDPVLAKHRWKEIEETTIYYCEHCPNNERYFTQIAHLNSHSSVMHKAELAAQINSREMGKIWAAQTASTNHVLGELLNRMPAPGESQLMKELREAKERIAELESQKGTN